MKILFWNIAKKLTTNQKQAISDLLKERSPDIISFAEGTESKKDCEALINFTSALGFDNYYNPLLGQKIPPGYPYHKVGLKVFTKNTLSIKPATFINTYELGRIVTLSLPNKNIKIFFIHGKSMINEPFDVSDFHKELFDRISISEPLNKRKHTIIIGDFNIEPWHRLLQRPNKIHSFFFKKAVNFYEKRIAESSRRGTRTLYYNPFLEYIQKHENELLIGTYYNSKSTKYPVSLLDFALFSNTMPNSTYQVEIITTIQDKPLLIREKGNTFIENGFDHLPIMIELK